MTDHSNTNAGDLAMLQATLEASPRPLPRTRDDESRRLLLPRCDRGCPQLRAGRLLDTCGLTDRHVADADVCAPAVLLAFDQLAFKGGAS